MSQKRAAFKEPRQFVTKAEGRWANRRSHSLNSPTRMRLHSTIVCELALKNRTRNPPKNRGEEPQGRELRSAAGY
jgi:hypothetical protein